MLAEIAAAKREAIIRKNKREQLAEYIAIGIATVILAALLTYGAYIYIMHIKK